MRLEKGGSSYPGSKNGDEGEKDEIDGSIRMVEDYQRYHCHSAPDWRVSTHHKIITVCKTAHCMVHSQLPGMELESF